MMQCIVTFHNESQKAVATAGAGITWRLILEHFNETLWQGDGEPDEHGQPIVPEKTGLSRYVKTPRRLYAILHSP